MPQYMWHYLRQQEPVYNWMGYDTLAQGTLNPAEVAPLGTPNQHSHTIFHLLHHRTLRARAATVGTCLRRAPPGREVGHVSSSNVEQGERGF